MAQTYAVFMQLGPFFDAGALAGGAKLYHYEPGTTTLKNIWAERTRVTALAQPFVSDAAGMFHFFADDGLYKYVIVRSSSTGPTDGILYTLDNWETPAPSGTWHSE